MVTPRSTDDLALVGRLLPRDHAEERRLAGTVGADEADLLAPLQRRRRLDEDDLPAVLLADAVETNHGYWTLTRSRALTRWEAEAEERFVRRNTLVPSTSQGRPEPEGRFRTTCTSNSRHDVARQDGEGVDIAPLSTNA